MPRDFFAPSDVFIGFRKVAPVQADPRVVALYVLPVALPVLILLIAWLAA